MPAATEELTLIFEHEQHRWDDTVIIRCRAPEAASSELFEISDPVMVKTTADAGELVPSLSYRFYGRWSQYKGERQFHAKTFVRCNPHGQAGVIRYLCQAPNVGQSTAAALWKKFGSDAVRILRETPDIAAAAVGGHFNLERATAASEWLEREKAIEACTIDLIDLLGGRGFPKTTAKKAVSTWGNRAAAEIRKNPYALMNFRGCGFLRCHQMYLDLGGDPARLRCQAMCAWYALSRDTNGHTWHPKDIVEAGLRGMVSGTAVRAPAAVKYATHHLLNWVSTRRDGLGTLWLAEGKKARNESRVADLVVEMLAAGPLHWPDLSAVDVSEHQCEQLVKSLTATIALFIGSPGTGKTYSAARLIAAILETEGAENIAICAPTGKAAVRITEAMQEYGLPLRAKTIHSLLVVKTRTEGEGWGFEHDADHPLPFRYVIADEASMIDCDLMASLLSAIATGTHVLFIGDVNQLPPVGHGAPLRDLIAAGVPCGELREIRRNAGTIVEVCAAIRDNDPWQVGGSLDLANGVNLKLAKASTEEAAADQIIESIKRLGNKVDPVWDVQVIVALNEKSGLSRKELNGRLQGELNPNGRSVSGCQFRTRDKVVCLKNGLLPIAESDDPAANTEAVDDKVFVANGELGCVLQVEEKWTVAQFDSPRRVIKILRGAQEEEADENSEADRSRFDLGYAISCHKSQGSEWPVVIVALDDSRGAAMVCDRSWIYTAISRAKRACILVGRKATADSMCLRNKIRTRKTFLADLIAERRAVKQKELAA